jgi:cytoplasmic iron level regulating protein YaaA (DUF328/UPF0246 family)
MKIYRGGYSRCIIEKDVKEPDVLSNFKALVAET